MYLRKYNVSIFLDVTKAESSIQWGGVRFSEYAYYVKPLNETSKDVFQG